jgi:hypothetical protein
MEISSFLFFKFLRVKNIKNNLIVLFIINQLKYIYTLENQINKNLYNKNLSFFINYTKKTRRNRN